MQIFQNNNIKISISDDCKSAKMKIAKENFFVDEKDILDLISKTNINKNNLINSPNKIAGEFFPIAQIHDTDEKRLQMVEIEPIFTKKKVKKDEIVANVIVKNELRYFGDEEVFLSYLVNKYLLGKNTYYKNKHILSKHTGNILVDEKSKKIDVIGEFSFDKNIKDMQNEEFFGDLELNGDLTNSKLKIFGSLTVKGNIIKSILDIKGELKVLNIIDSNIHSNGDIFCNCIKNSYILGGKKIIFEEQINISEVIARDSISSKNKDSKIFSSLVVTGSKISCSQIGDEDGKIAIIQISETYYAKVCSLKLNRLLFSEIPKKLKDRIKKELKELTLEIKEKQIKSYLSNKNSLKEISAFKSIFHGVMLKINNINKKIKKRQKDVTYCLINNSIQLKEVDDKDRK